MGQPKTIQSRLNQLNNRIKWKKFFWQLPLSLPLLASAAATRPAPAKLLPVQLSTNSMTLTAHWNKLVLKKLINAAILSLGKPQVWLSKPDGLANNVLSQRFCCHKAAFSGGFFHIIPMLKHGFPRIVHELFQGIRGLKCFTIKDV